MTEGAGDVGSPEPTPTEQQSGKTSLSFDQMAQVAELAFDGFKWFDAQGTEAIKTAARTLWLSNAGGLALVVGYAAKVEAMPQSATIALIVSAIAFITGVIFGVIPHVSMAHRITEYQVFVGELIFDAVTKRKTEADIQAEIFQLLGERRDKKGVITRYLVWAQRCLIIGAIPSVLSLAFKFMPLF